MTAELMALLLAVVPPPPQYDYPAPNLRVQFATLEQIEEWCGFKHAIGCSGTNPVTGECIILMPHGTPLDSTLFRHEQAHCNGWVHPKPPRDKPTP